MGVVKECGEVNQIITKSTQKPVGRADKPQSIGIKCHLCINKLEKRDLTIVDDSNQSIRLTLWGRQAMSFPGKQGTVVAIKNAKVGDFGGTFFLWKALWCYLTLMHLSGRSLSALSSSMLSIDPDIQECHQLSSWYASGGESAEFHSFAGSMGGGMGGGGGRKDVFKTVSQIKDENLGQGEKPDYFNLRGTVVYIRDENIAYPACPTEGCNKKLIEEGAQSWRCEKCQKTFERPNYRWVASFSDPILR